MAESPAFGADIKRFGERLDSGGRLQDIFYFIRSESRAELEAGISDHDARMNWHSMSAFSIHASFSS